MRGVARPPVKDDADDAHDEPAQSVLRSVYVVCMLFIVAIGSAYVHARRCNQLGWNNCQISGALDNPTRSLAAMVVGVVGGAVLVDVELNLAGRTSLGRIALTVVMVIAMFATLGYRVTPHGQTHKLCATVMFGALNVLACMHTHDAEASHARRDTRTPLLPRAIVVALQITGAVLLCTFTSVHYQWVVAITEILSFALFFALLALHASRVSEFERKQQWVQRRRRLGRAMDDALNVGLLRKVVWSWFGGNRMRLHV